MSGTAFDTLVNASVGNITDNVALSNVTEFAKLDIAESVSSDKIFSLVSDKSSSNAFSVFDSKQVVSELSTASNSTSNERISKLEPSGITNLTNKLKTDITSDSDYDSAVKDVFSNVTTVKQNGFDLKNNNYNGISKIVSDVASTVSKVETAVTTSLDGVLKELLPSSMTTTDYGILQSIFNGTNGLSNFSSCSDLTKLLKSAGLLDLSSLTNSLRSLIALLTKYDIAGLLSCIESITESIDNFDIKDMTESLVDSGSINSFNEISRVTSSNSSVVDKYTSLRRMGTNTPSNRFSSTTMDSILGNFNNTDKTKLLTEKNNTRNTSILTDDTSIYSKSAIENASSSFANYSIGDSDTSSLIANVPESLFV